MKIGMPWSWAAEIRFVFYAFNADRAGPSADDTYFLLQGAGTTFYILHLVLP
jgi:hypothetical protein